MLIDWFTVGAQLLNFLILVWLLKRFLYQPILNAIDAREQRIASALAQADTQQAEAQSERDKFRLKNEAFEEQRNALLGQATEAANAERQRLFDAARQAADAMRAKRSEDLDNEFQNLHEDIVRRNQQEVLAIARKMLIDLAGISLEQRMSEVFVRYLRELNDEAKAGLAATLKTGGADSVLVRSAFELSSKQRAAIEDALNQAFSITIPTRFETAPQVIVGIELSVNGWKLGWSIADYLAALEKTVSTLLAEPSNLVAKTSAGTERESKLGFSAATRDNAK